MNDSNNRLRFDGSLWCNLDIALRNIDGIFSQIAQPLGITVIELYILRVLYEQDGQNASKLAQQVGRAATSFTPNLDKLEKRNYIMRRPDPDDRRAIRIFLTEEGESKRDYVVQEFNKLDQMVTAKFNGNYQEFSSGILLLQTLDFDM